MGRLLLSGARFFVFQSCSSPSIFRLSQQTLSRRRWSPGCSSSLPSLPFCRAFGTVKKQYPAMAADLPVSVEGLSLQSTSETSKFANCFPSLNPVDIYREHIAEKLSEGTGIEADKIYARLMWTNALDKGDLVLPVR